MRFNPKARGDSNQTDNREGSGGGGFGGGLGGGGMRMPIPTGGGKIGLGTIVLVVLFLLVTQCSGNGIIPSGGDGSSSGAQGDSQSRGTQEECTGEKAASDEGCAIDLFTVAIQDYWSRALPQQANMEYQRAKTVRYSGTTSSGCGTAQSTMGPFYCPNDTTVYIDKSFTKDMLQGQLGAKGGPFALGYVMAHEYGHRIEDQLGILGKMRTQQGPKSDGVRVELMADCLAGMWAKDATTSKDADGNTIITELTQDDIKRAIDAAQAVGDDRIQKRAQGRVNQEAWTHGSSEQRVRWFNKGMETGSLKACNTFNTDNL